MLARYHTQWSYGTLKVQMILNYQGEKQWRGLEYIVVVLSNSDCNPELCNSQRPVIGNGELNSILYQQFLSLRGHHLISTGGISFCGGGIIYFNPARRRAKFFKILPHVYHVYIEHIEQK